MKAFWKIHDKPRGRWRPLLEWGIHFSPQEEQEAKALNIRDDIKYCLRLDLGDFADSKQVGKVCPRSYVILPFAGKLYRRDSSQAECADSFGSPVCCSENCPFEKKGQWSLESSAALPLTRQYRLEWRPGRRPDYSDYIEPLRIFLRCLLKEAERRFTEARESTPSDEWLLEEEFDSFSWRTTEDGVEVAERKLRVIRK